jgi:hypothetical protein
MGITTTAEGNHSHSPIRLLQHYACDSREEQWIIDDIDQIILKRIYKVLGDLMIKRRINLMVYWIPFQEYVQNNILLPLHIMEVDYCRVLIILPLRLLCIVAMIVLNAYMIGSFLRGMKESGTMVGTTLSTASNFFWSAVYGYWIWKEQMNMQWCIGFTCVLLGVIILSNVQAVDDEISDNNATRRNDASRSKQKELKPWISSSIQTTTPSVLTTGNVAALRSVFTNNDAGAMGELSSSKNQDRNRMSTPPHPISLKIQSKFVSVTPSLRINDPKDKDIATRSDASQSSTTNSKASSLKKSHRTLKAESELKQYYEQQCPKIKRDLNNLLIDRTFLNECVLCEGTLFDDNNNGSLPGGGESNDDDGGVAIADLSLNTCYHIFHATCLKKSAKSFRNACPICKKPLLMWTTAKHAAQFPGFWLHRVEQFLLSLNGPPSDPTTGQPLCLSATIIREHLTQDDSLTLTQKKYIHDDPTGMGKGLQATLEWGGFRDYNTVPKGHVGFFDCLRTNGLWKYDPKRDDIWFWQWGPVHPRKRCDQCQLMKQPLQVPCQGCQGSAEAAFYCTESCCKRDWQRHRQTCQKWKDLGPPSKKM